MNYSVKLVFEEISFPPFDDVLILAKDSEFGKIGLSSALELLIPGTMEVITLEHEHIEAVFISKKILKKLSQKTVLGILTNRVFPYISKGQLFRVSINLKMYDEFITGDANDK